MNIQQYAKKDIALNQIETALALYFNNGDLFSVITLAGAAEEILGQLLQNSSAKGGVLKSLWQILRPGNSERGGRDESAGWESDEAIHMDLQQEARFLLGRAIADYRKLSGTLSAGMVRFHEEARALPQPLPSPTSC